MSKLEVDKIDPQSGTDLELGSSGDTITIPTGVTLDASNATTTLPANVVTTDGTQTLTNKTIAAGSNTVTGLTNSNLSGSAAISNANLANSSITINDTAVSLGGSTSISTGGMYKNIIINGDMSIAQRGTSQSSITSGGYYTVDRFDFDVVTMGTWTQSQSTDVPTGQGFAKSLKFDCTTADASPVAGDRVFIKYKIEGQNLQYLKKGTSNAKSLSLSFWVKSNKTGTYIAELYDVDNQRQISKSYTIDSASTWEKKTITFAGDTTGAFDNDNGNSLQLSLWLGAGSGYTSGTLSTSWTSATSANRAVGQVNLADSTSNEWYITGVQLEAGTTASDFEFLPHDVNERKCQRYYFDYVKGTDQNVGMFTAYATQGRLYGHIDFPVRMRTTPSLVSSNNSGDFASRKGNTENFNNFAGFQHTGTLNCNIYSVDTITTVSSGEVVWVNTSASTSQISFQAEL